MENASIAGRGRFVPAADEPVPAADDPGLVTAEKIISTVEQIVALAKPLRIVAFGSRARGEHRLESDLDLAVIVSRYDPKTDQRPVWRSDVDAYMSVDLLVLGRERYEFMKGSIISVERQIEKDGVTLYDESIGSVDRGAAARLAS